MYSGWSNRKVNRLSDVDQILNLLKGGIKYTTLVEFPSCVRSFIIQNIQTKEAKEKLRSPSALTDKYFLSVQLSLNSKVDCFAFTLDRTNIDPVILHNNWICEINAQDSCPNQENPY